MDDGDIDFRSMNDPDFLAERKRIREAIAALQEQYEAINEEFDRRARAAWTKERQAS